ncbi:chorismate-binding protein [Flavobacterium gawalongense]|uniref:isochorismate synthase n=1 Tax=Flavobacterium gawalongense TaxID=2594432 RepID=A0A553BCG7_9FLAO|nr:chorismate-binding protein [Flavobacterium gawalongense]TRX00281.1 isochorismate synthase [Flavobacterium gawalongense]TRX05398.1 isochorismate synthase [Flavobacterium gawalongense]TRX05942.1 isochorismate synthase [Flavobacterium gawalongense]TRX10272.1 isochorismate synthase [Flavobacterium gawalongense]TRX27719.1 isochorismate synthase [Flavobacterium gawalongense]
MEAILDKAKNQLEQSLPFVLYCKPNSDMVIGLFQQNDELYKVEDFTEKGFAFVSFDGNQTYLIPENQSEIVGVIWDKKKVDVLEREFKEPNGATKNNFERLVAKGIQAIENDEFKKVVLSRKETVDLVDFDLVTTFEKLVQLYPATFVYCFFHPKVGIWLGATPEQLLKANVNVFETMALAGTQKDNGSGEIVWDKKEKEEQQYVTDYIVSALQGVALEVSVTKPYSVKAGSIWHIKTDIWGVLNSNSSLQQVINLLHPTPAVCGLPKDQSKAFILENENYGRSFYTGFLGELNSSFATDSVSSNLFVNLRCMQIVDSQAYLYMGCGITKDSIPEKEWSESINKSMTMKRVLDFR